MTATATDRAGNINTRTISFTVITDAIGPSIIASPDRAANSAGWWNSPVIFGFACGDAESTVAICPSPVSMIAPIRDGTVVVNASDVFANTTTLVVDHINIDDTSPAITIAGPAHGAVIRAADYVPPTCMASDGLSGVAGSCAIEITETASGSGVRHLTATATATDMADNFAERSISYTIITDTDAPTITATPNQTANSAGWWHNPVTYSFVCTDADSTVSVCPSPLTLATSGANQTFTVTATDAFDNVGQLTVAGINIDTQAPTVTLTYSPSATPSATCTATDGLSGIGSPCQISAPTLLPSGQYQISATATDNAGNTGSATLNYSTTTADRQFIINLIAQLQQLPLSGSAAQNRNKTITSLTTAITQAGGTRQAQRPRESNGKKIFDELHNAVQDLAKITNPATQQAVRDLLAMTRRWGTNAINAAIARGATSNNVAQATSKIALGDDKAAHNNPADAIDAFRNAWTAATNAT